jgi:ribosomal protein S18 acetylase RimI-like enzyme
MVKIKLANESDAEVIASLGSVTFTETFGDLFPKPELEDYLIKTFSVAKIHTRLKKPNNIYWVAYVDETPAGYAKIKLNSRIDEIRCERQIQLQKIYVLKEYLDKKIGLALLSEIMANSEIISGTLIWLVVLHTNERAIWFYEKSGFRKFSEHFHQIGKLNFKYELMVMEI